MKFYTYILFSGKLNKYYTGYSENIELRLEKHNQKHRGFSGKASDWKIVYFEEFNSKKEAMDRELEIKRKKSRKYIEFIINDSMK